jgi:hypothetical protein
MILSNVSNSMQGSLKAAPRRVKQAELISENEEHGPGEKNLKEACHQVSIQL